MCFTVPRESTASTNMSPTQVARCGEPSTPEIVSDEGRTFTRSDAWGCTCQVQPLSTTNVTPR
eukprot:2751188-Pleurochrysis_carterae.AAC.1